MISSYASIKHPGAGGLAWVAAGVLWLAGCAGPETREGVDPPASPAREAMEVPLAPLDPDVIYYVGAAEILGQREQFEASARYYRKAAMLSDDPSIAARALRVAAFAEDEDLTLAGVERWLELDPANIEPHRFAAIIELRRGETDAALEHLSRLLVDPRSAEAWTQVGKIIGATPNRGAGRAVLARLLARHTPPPDLEVLSLLSDLTVQYRLFPEAEGLTSAAIELEPENAEHWNWRGRIRHSLGRREAARQDFARAVELAPEDAALRQSYAALLAELGEYAAALEALEGVSDSPSILYSRALYAEALGDRDQAMAWLRDLEAADAEDRSRKHFLLGQLAETLEQPTERILAYYAQVDSGQYLDDARLRSAVVLARDDQLPQARVMLRKLQNGSAGTAARAFQAEAALLRDAGRNAEAMDVYDNALSLLPEDVDLLFARALHAEAMDRIDVAESDLRRVLELNPDDPNALNALGYTLADRTDRYQEALALIERAYEQLPDEAAVVDSMGWIQFKLGNHAAALEYLERAMTLEPDPEIAAHLGEVLWALGREAEAIEVWDRALADDPDALVVQETRERLLAE